MVDGHAVVVQGRGYRVGGATSITGSGTDDTGAVGFWVAVDRLQLRRPVRWRWSSMTGVVWPNG